MSPEKPPNFESPEETPEEKIGESPLTADDVSEMLRYDMDLSAMKGEENVSRLRAELERRKAEDPNKEIVEEEVASSSEEKPDREAELFGWMGAGDKETRRIKLEINLLPERHLRNWGQKEWDKFIESIGAKRDAMRAGINRGWEKLSTKKGYPEADLSVDDKDQFDEIETPTFIKRDMPAEESDEEGESEADDLGGEKGLERPSGTRAGRRVELLKSWEEMTEDERRDKYGNRYERAERLYAFEKIRANFIVLEKEYNRRNNPGAKLLELIPSKDRKAFEELEEEYTAARLEYEDRRAEHIASRTWLMLNERMRLAEQEALKHQEGKFEKMRERWRWLGEQNLDKLLSKKGIEPKGKFGKFFTRMVSLRTMASLGLLGGGMAIGFGSAVGIGLLAARRVMGGTGVAFGSYDLMSQASERKLLNLDVDEKKIDSMSSMELAEAIASFEAQAKFSGERIVHSSSYDKLRKRYHSKVEEKGEVTKDGIRTAIWSLDSYLRSREEKLVKREKHRKVAAVGIGLFSIGAFSAGDVAKWLEGKPEFSGITPEQIQEVIEEGPIIPPEVVEEGVEQEAALPPVVVEEADSVTVEVVPADTSAVAQPDTTTGGAAPDTTTAPGVEEGPPPVEVEVISGTVEQGGSASREAWDMVREGRISEEQLTEAWTSAASTVELESGQTIHISELGLTHVGDQVVYVPATEDLEAHFRVIDYTEDVFHVGSNQDLAAAFETEGKDIPQWLQDAIGAEEAPFEIPEPGPVGEELLRSPRVEPRAIEAIPIPEGVVSPEEAFEKAAEGTLEFADQRFDFEWGTARFIVDEDGKIADIFLDQKIGGEKLFQLEDKAIQSFLNPDYQDAISQNAINDSAAFRLMGRARRDARQIYQLTNILDAIKDSNPAGAEFIRYKIGSIRRLGEVVYKIKIFKL